MKKFNFISNANRALSLFWLVAISLSIIGIAFAAAPNPGHDITAVSGGAVQGDLFYGSAVDTLSALAKNITATRYLSNTGASNNPAWAQIDLTNGVTGALPDGNISSAATWNAKMTNPMTTLGDIIYGGASGVATRLGGSAGFLKSTGAAAPTWSAVSLTADVSGILPTANGGTGIAFFTAAGPTVARTYTFPDAAATVLTSNAAVTVAQGGTALTAAVSDAVLVGDSTSAYTARTLPVSCAGTTAKLLYDSTTNLFSCGTDQTGGGATYVVTTADVASTASTAYQNITGLSWSLAASTRYDIECKILYAASATTIGLGIGWTGPASPLLTTGQMRSGLTTATVGGTTSVGNDTGAVTTASVATTNNHAFFEGFWSNGTTAGTLQMRFKPETATVNGIIIKAGSWCKYSTY